jgi:hypothetical protein
MPNVSQGDRSWKPPLWWIPLARKNAVPHLRIPDVSGEMGFELQFTGGVVEPRRMHDATDFIISSQGIVNHAYDSSHVPGTVLSSYTNFDLTMESSRGPECHLSRQLRLPCQMLCPPLELVSRPVPLREFSAAVDAVQRWAAGPWYSAVGSPDVIHLNFSGGRVIRGHGILSGGRALLDARVFPQTTIAVRLSKLRCLLRASLNYGRQSTGATWLGTHRRPARPNSFDAFLWRVDAVCRAQGGVRPEVYCGLLALCGHAARTIGLTSKSRDWAATMRTSMPKVALTRSCHVGGSLRGTWICGGQEDVVRPFLHRTNLASAWNYVREHVSRDHPSLAPGLAERFRRDMSTVLKGDLPDGMATALFDMTLRTYEIDTSRNMLLIARRIHPLLPNGTAGLVAMAKWLAAPRRNGSAERSKGQSGARYPPRVATDAERSLFSKNFRNRFLDRGVRVTRPGRQGSLRVSDWVDSLTRGVDLLSDHGNWFGVPVFKSIGSWEIGTQGQVHIENPNLDFDFGRHNATRSTSGVSQPGAGITIRRSLARLRNHASQLDTVLRSC